VGWPWDFSSGNELSLFSFHTRMPRVSSEKEKQNPKDSAEEEYELPFSSIENQ
jgi:hypothetical protein